MAADPWQVDDLDLEGYLGRVGVAARAPSRAALAELHEAHVRTFTFDNVDVLPSVFSLLDWRPLPAAWEGRDFRDGLRPPRTVSFSSLDRDFAARTPDWKLLLREDGGREFFDLTGDPGETRAGAPPPALAERIDAAFREWHERHASDLYLESTQALEPEDLSPETIETLRTLGYIE